MDFPVTAVQFVIVGILECLENRPTLLRLVTVEPSRGSRLSKFEM